MWGTQDGREFITFPTLNLRMTLLIRQTTHLEMPGSWKKDGEMSGNFQQGYHFFWETWEWQGILKWSRKTEQIGEFV